jgi:hypothetical protein
VVSVSCDGCLRSKHTTEIVPEHAREGVEGLGSDSLANCLQACTATGQAAQAIGLLFQL